MTYVGKCKTCPDTTVLNTLGICELCSTKPMRRIETNDKADSDTPRKKLAHNKLKVNPKEVEAMVYAYDKGMNIETISWESGRSTSCIYKVLSRNFVRFRRAGRRQTTIGHYARRYRELRDQDHG